MSLLRRQRSPLARLALFAFLCGAMLPFYEAHPLGADDGACQLPGGEQGAARVGAPGAGDISDHCVVCHLQRGLNGAVPSNLAALSTPFESSSCQRFDQPAPPSASSAAPSTRGPPVLSI